MSSIPTSSLDIGDEAALNAAKIMWLLYENPEADLAALAGGAAFPQLGTKAKLVLIPTAGGTGSACCSLCFHPGWRQEAAAEELQPDSSDGRYRSSAG